MGLDMYLSKRAYVRRDERNQLRITGLKRKFDGSKVLYIAEDAGYWRKANQIHNWFVQNVQRSRDDCHEYHVSHDQLKELLRLVEEVLADHSKSGELLPAVEGYFFGSTEYDEWYFSNVEETQKILIEALADEDESIDFTYRSSW
jgi:hypothetical protein